MKIIEPDLEKGFIITRLSNFYFIFLCFSSTLHYINILYISYYIFTNINYNDDILLFGNFNCYSLKTGKFTYVDKFLLENNFIFIPIYNSDIGYFNGRFSSCIEHLYVSSSLLNKVNGPNVDKDICCSNHKFIHYKFNCCDQTIEVKKYVSEVEHKQNIF